MACLRPYVKVSPSGIPAAFRCGDCVDCRDYLRWQKSSAISLEAMQHRYGGTSPIGAFVTVTYDDGHLPKAVRDTRRWVKCFEAEPGHRDRPGYRLVSGSLGPGTVDTLDRRDAQLFLKRVRQRCFPLEERKKAAAAALRSRLGVVADGVRYAMCGEYGTSGTLRPHLHFILFGFPSCCRGSGGIKNDLSCRCSVCSFYRDCWKCGERVGARPFDGEHARYMSKYIAKLAPDGVGLDGRVPQFFEASRKPPLGDAAVREEAELILDGVRHFEDHSFGEQPLDFPSRIERGGRKYLLSRRQVELGRELIGGGGVPEAKREMLELVDQQIVAEAMELPREYRADLVRERKFALASAARAERDAAREWSPSPSRLFARRSGGRSGGR